LLCTCTPPPTSPLFPYTTLFRSGHICLAPVPLQHLGRQCEPGAGERSVGLVPQARAMERGGKRFLLGRTLLLEAQMAGILEAERSEEHTSELQSRSDLVCRLLLE